MRRLREVTSRQGTMLALLVGLALCFPSSASALTLQRLTDDNLNQSVVDVSSRHVLYFGEDYWLWSADSNTSAPMPKGSSADPLQWHHMGETFAAGEMLQTSNGANDRELVVCDLATGSVSQLTENAGNDWCEDIDGSRLASIQWNGADWDVLLWDVNSKTSRKVAGSPDNEAAPKISGDWMVWESRAPGLSRADVYAQRLSTQQTVRVTSTAKSNDTYVVVGDGYVAWAEYEHESDAPPLMVRLLVRNLTTGSTTKVAELPISGSHTIHPLEIRDGWLSFYARPRDGVYQLGTGTTRYLPEYLDGGQFRLSGGSLFGGRMWCVADQVDVNGSQIEPGASRLVTWDYANGGVTEVVAESFDALDAPMFGGGRLALTARPYGRSGEIYSAVVGAPPAPLQRDTSVSLTAPSVSKYASAKLSGYLKDSGGRPLKGESVEIQYRDGSSWKTLGKVSTNTSGQFSYGAAPKVKTTYRVRFAGADAYKAATSGSKTVLPKVYLTRPSFGRTTLAYGKAYRAKGYCKPRHRKGSYVVKIKAYRKSASGKWVYKKSYSAKAYNYASYTKYLKSIKLPKKGKWRLRAVHAGDSQNATTYSSWRYVTVK